MRLSFGRHGSAEAGAAGKAHGLDKRQEGKETTAAESSLLFLRHRCPGAPANPSARAPNRPVYAWKFYNGFVVLVVLGTRY
jgi:hypothetical protein